METTDEKRAFIQANLRVGDYAVVAGMVGLEADTVMRIVKGTRRNDGVLSLFASYLEARQELEQKLKVEVK